MPRWPLLAIFVLAAGQCLLPAVARARARLISCSPSADSVAEGAPNVAVLDFSEAVRAAAGDITVKSASGQRMDEGGVRVVGSPQHLAVELKTLVPGRYVVHWRVTGTDSENSRGSYAFTVAQ